MAWIDKTLDYADIRAFCHQLKWLGRTVPVYRAQQSGDGFTTKPPNLAASS